MSDTWSDIQAVKTKQSSMRAKLLERKRQREGLVAEMTNASSTESPSSSATVSSAPSSSSIHQPPRAGSPLVVTQAPLKTEPVKIDAEVKKKLLLVLCDINLDIPCNATIITEHTSKMLGREVKLSVIEDLLEQLSNQQLLSIVSKESKDQSRVTVTSLDLSKLSADTKNGSDDSSNKRKRESDDQENTESSSKHAKMSSSNKTDDSIESLLSMQSAKEREHKKVQEEILLLLSKPTAKEQFLVEKFSSQGGAQLQEFCQYGTKDECMKTNQTPGPCKRLHFRKILHKHTDESLGDCSFLNTCFHMDTCKYVHYEIDYPEKNKNQVALLKKELSLSKKVEMKDGSVTMFPPQWVQCDLRYFDMSVLGKCAVVMADPPWDIHMELPYGTMSDDEMRKLDVPNLQDDGFLFLWVTGRAMELGRECLELWGYKRVDELIWVKTNQLQRIIRTGRTGHWLNHGKEHCLVGVKGDPKGVNRGLDCDVIVAEVRATSHKPDEIYGIIERLSPGTRKVELFGRPHNVQPNWITLGNQVDGVRLKDPDVVSLFQKRYPNGNCMEPPK